jgi:hypothetical protein
MGGSYPCEMLLATTVLCKIRIAPPGSCSARAKGMRTVPAPQALCSAGDARSLPGCRRIEWSCRCGRDEREEKPVKLSLAPMEGITGPVFREAHASCFGALDSCYLPFIAPAHPGKPFTEKTLKALGEAGWPLCHPPAADEGCRRFCLDSGPSGRARVQRGQSQCRLPFRNGRRKGQGCRASARCRGAREIPAGHLRKVASARLSQDPSGPG